MSITDKGKLFVSKSNKIIDAQYKLNAREQKFILYMASRIRPDDTDFDFHEVKISDIVDVLNVSGKKQGGIHKQFFKMCQNLSKKPIHIKNENGKTSLINWVASVEFHQSKGIISFEFSKRLKPYLLNLKAHFTKYSLEYVMRLGSIYSIRLYEILKRHQFKTPPKFTIGVGELKAMLDIVDSYDEYRYFKKRIIKKAQEELEEKTDIYFEYDEHRVSRKVVSLTFHIYKNKERQISEKKPVEVQTTLFLEDEAFSSDVVSRLIKLGLKRDDAKNIYNKGFDIIQDEEVRESAKNSYSDVESYINSKIDLLEFDQKQYSKKNPQGFLIKALKENYMNDELVKFQKRKKVEKDEKVRKSIIQKLEYELKALRKAKYEQEEPIMNDLLNNVPNIIKTIAKEYNVESELLYDKKESLEKNYERPSIRGSIHYKIKEKYSDRFEAIWLEFDPKIEKLKLEIEKI